MRALLGGLVVAVATASNAEPAAVTACQKLKRQQEEQLGAWRVYGSHAQDALLRSAEVDCERKMADCCLRAGQIYLSRVTPTEDRTKGRALLERGCEIGSGEACWALGEDARLGNEQNRADAVRWAARAAKLYSAQCDQGQAAGCVGLGIARATGASQGSREAALLYERALHMFKEKCSIADAAACYGLGALVDEITQCNSPGKDHEVCRLGVTTGAVKPGEYDALDAYVKGCDGGSARSCSAAASRFLLGSAGAKRDSARGVALARRACELGSTEECLFLGWSYEKADHHLRAELYDAVFRDSSAARLMYERGCDWGDAASCYELGTAYAKGRIDVTVDAKKGRELLGQACDDGFEPACKERDAMGK